jgi:hypothetical protein
MRKRAWKLFNLKPWNIRYSRVAGESGMPGTSNFELFHCENSVNSVAF